MAPRQRLEIGKKIRCRRHHATRHQHRLDDDRGHLWAVQCHDPFETREIVEGRDQRATLDVTLPVEPGFEIGVTAVIGANGFHDVGAARHVPGRLDGQHARFGTGVREAHELHRPDPILQRFGKGNLRMRRTGPSSSPLNGCLHGFARGSVIVAVYETQPVAEQVQVATLVHIPEPGAIGTLDDHGIRRVKAGRPGIAARHHPRGMRHQRRGTGRGSTVAILDGCSDRQGTELGRDAGGGLVIQAAPR